MVGTKAVCLTSVQRGPVIYCLLRAFHLFNDADAISDYVYSSNLSLTSAVDGSGWSAPRPGRFTAGKETWYHLYRRLDGPQGQSGRLRKILPPRPVQPIANRSESLDAISKLWAPER